MKCVHYIEYWSNCKKYKTICLIYLKLISKIYLSNEVNLFSRLNFAHLSALLQYVPGMYYIKPNIFWRVSSNDVKAQSNAKIQELFGKYKSKPVQK